MIHITISKDTKIQSHIIHCSRTICTNQFSGKNLWEIVVVDAAICHDPADSILFHIWLAGQAIQSQYHHGLYANISRLLDKFSALFISDHRCKNKSFLVNQSIIIGIIVTKEIPIMNDFEICFLKIILRTKYVNKIIAKSNHKIDVLEYE